MEKKKKERERNARLELNYVVLCFAKGVIVLLLMLVSEWNIDSVPYKGCVCLSQGLNGQPRKVKWWERIF